MLVIEVGIMSFVPKGYFLAEDGEEFGGNIRIFAITNIRGQVISKWAKAASARDGKRTFLEWFKREYPYIVPPYRGNIHIFREKASSPA